MKVKINEVIKTLAGKPIIIDGTEKKDDKGKVIEGTGDPITLKFLCTNALEKVYNSENSLSGQEKYERGVLAKRIYAADNSIDLKSEEITLLKKLIGMAYSSLVIEQAWNMLENSDA